ncbi:MAG: DUF885 domain-containing protein [Myxococcota bacterium]
MRARFLGALLTLAACRPTPAPPPPPPGATVVDTSPSTDSRELGEALREARAGVDHEGLASLLERHWRAHLVANPIFSTRLGIHDFDDRLADLSHATRVARDERRQGFLADARTLPADELSGSDRVTLELFIALLDDETFSTCRFHLWSVDSRNNLLTSFNRLPEDHQIKSVRDYENLVARYRSMGRQLDATMANLRRGSEVGLLAPRESLRRVIAMLTDQLAQPRAEWPLLKPVREPSPSLSDRERALLENELRRVVDDVIEPGLRRDRALLSELAVQGRSQDQSGLASLPLDGCYANQVRAFTTLSLTPAEVHRRGLAAIAVTDAAFVEVGRRALRTTDLSATLARLRTAPELRFRTEQEVEQAARETLVLAQEKAPAFFGRLPKAPCVVQRVPAFEAPYTSIAYYRPPHADGSKPGEYFINVLDPTSRPRFEARVLAVHEAVPGHHLQIAIAQELDALPAFRKHEGFTAFVEGWALYTEQLAEEMGLSRDDLDRLGKISFESWRAGRLVVDTGLHDLGWSRRQAQQFLREHTALTDKNIENEVDRYINWPGQALAYKIGQEKILELRRDAESTGGARFELARFHDVVLGGGAVSLPVLEKRVRAWIDRSRR